MAVCAELGFGGQVQAIFGPTASIGYIQADGLHALDVMTATRFEELPDAPTVGECVRGYEAIQWYGVGTPAGYSRRKCGSTASPQMKARFAVLVWVA
jgi:tripartite-type tricarboxylate transporter receptor subunit TctC